MSILFLGPVPPPVHGFSVINAAMLDKLRADRVVWLFNRAPPKDEKSSLRPLRGVLRSLGLLAGFATRLIKSRPRALYAGFSGGSGQLLDLPFFLLARATGVSIHVHHHSYAYLNQYSWLTAMCMRSLRNARHIVLCSDMAQRLQARYGIDAGNISVLSNAAFVGTSAQGPEVSVAPAAPVPTVGFLSNITEEKGIFDFLDILRRAEAAGLPFDAEIAGPLDASIADRFHGELKTLPQVKYIGGVYGADKDRFFERISVLIFPSKYQNEAEPVTILEALRAGVSVVATQRGCIGGMLGGQCGRALGPAELVEGALEALRVAGASSREVRAQARLAIQQEFKVMQQQSLNTLELIIDQIGVTSGPQNGA
jgi:glycosyltransferase involved in cell wall biosynthesis